MRRVVRIAVAGVGLIGKRHVEAIAAVDGVTLAGIADPAEPARAYAEERGVIWYPTLTAMIEARIADGVILATPNDVHLENVLECVEAGMPAIVEKPVAVDVVRAEKLVAAGEAAGVALLVGHHRRHNPLIQKAREVIQGGELGTISAVQGTCWLYKPDDYFDVSWRRQPGGGPVLVNLIHDVDLLRYLCGEIEAVHALESNAVRGNPVEETAAIVLRFASGALGTINISDTIVAPWSWELTARENPAYPQTHQACYLIGGTNGSLELPSLKLWRYRGPQSWWELIDATSVPFGFEDPLIRQVRQFAAVVRGEEAPLATAREGLETLRVIEAVKRSAQSGETVHVKAGSSSMTSGRAQRKANR